MTEVKRSLPSEGRGLVERQQCQPSGEKIDLVPMRVYDRDHWSR